MDSAGRFRCRRIAADGPSPCFLWPDGKEGDEVEQLVTGADDLVQSGFAEAKGFEEFGLFLCIIDEGNLALDLG